LKASTLNVALCEVDSLAYGCQ